MAVTTMETLEKRIQALESGFGKAGKTDKVDKTDKTDKKPRKPSDYNKFMSKYIADNKSPSKTHPELFSEAAKAWTTSKK